MKYLSDKSVAARYDISRASVWRWLKEGKLPRPEKLTNGTTRWKLSQLEAAEAEREASTK